MNETDLQAKGFVKNARGEWLKRKPNDNHPDTQISDPKPERDQATALERAETGEVACVGRVVVSFTLFRVRPLDPDNAAGGCKDLLDGIRHARLIHGDEPWKIRLEVQQFKVKSFKEERTVIEITTP